MHKNHVHSPEVNCYSSSGGKSRMVRTTITIAIARKYCSVYPRELPHGSFSVWSPAGMAEASSRQCLLLPGISLWEELSTSQTPSGLPHLTVLCPGCFVLLVNFGLGEKGRFCHSYPLLPPHNATHTDVPH